MNELVSLTLARLFTFFFVTTIVLYLAKNAEGQTVGPVPELALELAPSFNYSLSDQTFFSEVRYSRIASTDQINGGSKSTGLVQTVFLSVGTRTEDFEDYEFRWRAGLLHMDLIRLPISLGATLLDYNQAGYMDVDFQWFNFRLGPSIYLGNQRTYFTLRTVGNIGLTTAELGDFMHEGLSTREGLSLRKRSYEVGYTGELHFYFANLISINGTLQFRHLLGGIRPKVYTIKGLVGVRATDYLSFLATYSIYITRSGTSTTDQNFIGLGLGILL